MKILKRKIVVILMTVFLFATFATVAYALFSDVGISDLWKEANEKEGILKYEKPSVGDIAKDGEYPEEINSEASAEAQEKQWYEYVTYSKTPCNEQQFGRTKYVFYDPYDYNYGIIVKFSDPKNEYGDFYDPEGYTTANEITVSYSKSKSTSWSSDSSVSFGFEEEGGASIPLLANATAKFTQTFGWTDSDSESEDSSSSKDVTYNALYFNANGTPYRWRVIKYNVYLPLYCERQILVNGEWVVKDSDYCLLSTVEGTCREWINNVAYVEDWRTGEPIQVEKFWEKFFTDKKLIAACIYNMIPKE